MPTPSPDASQQPHPDRRTLVAGLAAGGVALPILAACGGGSVGDGNGVTGSSATSPGGSARGSGALTATGDVPVGGGKVFGSEKVVVTQPTAGQFKAFSAVCTHMSCLVTDVSDGLIHCPCHGSEFSITDGSVQGGPAPRPLPAERITVANGEIRLA